MTAAGQNGIPTAFVVGKDSRIAWIGHPMDPEFPKTLDSLLDGTFDAVAAKATAQRKAEAAGAMQKAMATVTAAYKKGDDATADAAMKSLVAGYPDTAGMVLNIRFNRALEKGNETGAHTVLREGWSAADLDAEDLNNFAWALVTDKRIKNRDYPLAIAIATRGVELSEEKNAPIIDTLAYALFYGGKVDEAIAWEQKAVDLTGGKDQAMVDALTQYKKAKG
ncbi:hypothetical protein EON77_13305 [bacterium]|nr:MAG: hypothetical protein EON77_13305 [bacterium]